MFRKKQEIQAALSDIDEARASRERGVLAEESVVAARPTVESWAGTVRERRLRNGLGDEYMISMIPRWRTNQ